MLFVDVIRPLRPPADQLNRALISAIGRSPYIRDARNRHEAWERRFEALPGRGPADEPGCRSDARPSSPQADIFAKVDDPRLEEYRLAESLDLLPFYRELDGEIGPTVALRGPAGGDARLQQLPGPDHRPPGAGRGRSPPSTATAPGSPAAGCSTARSPSTASSRSCWPTGSGLESALVFTTGYAANLGLLGALVGPGDAAIVDSAAHASLVDGARFSEGTLRAFRHNRPNSLRRTLRSWREQPDAGGVLVAVDGIYSMEGDWAPLAEIAALCTDFGARLLVDEAHALGVVGPRGRRHRGRHRRPAGPDHGHLLQVPGQLRRVHRRPPGRHRLPQDRPAGR